MYVYEYTNGWLAYLLACRPPGWLAGWLAGRPPDLPAGKLAGRLACRLAGSWLAGRLAGWPALPTAIPKPNEPRPAENHTFRRVTMTKTRPTEKLKKFLGSSGRGREHSQTRRKRIWSQNGQFLSLRNGGFETVGDEVVPLATHRKVDFSVGWGDPPKDRLFGVRRKVDFSAYTEKSTFRWV